MWTPEMIVYHEIIRLPLLSQAKEYLGTIAKEADLTIGLEAIDLCLSSLSRSFEGKLVYTHRPLVNS